MPEYTPLKKLYKPNRRDILEVDTTLSENFTIIDVEFGKVENEIKKTNATIDQLVIEGDSSVEAAQARLSSDGQVYDTLKERLDTEHQSTAALLADMVTVNLKVTNADDITNDLKNAIALINAKGGGILNIPYKKDGYKVADAGIALCNNLIVEGNGSTFYITSNSSTKLFFSTIGLKNIVIKNINAVAPMDKLVPRTETPNNERYSSNVYLFSLQGENILIDNVFADGMEVGVMFNHPSLVSKNIKIRNFKTVNSNQPLFLKNIDSGWFENLDFDCTISWSGLDHHIYINGNAKNLFFSRLILTGGKETYGIQIKRDSTSIAVCDNIHFRDVVMKGACALNISDANNIFIEGVYATSPVFTGYCLRIDQTKNVIVTRFNFEGSYAGALSITNSSNVKLSNGGFNNTNTAITSNQINLINLVGGVIDNIKVQAIKSGSYNMLYSGNSVGNYVIRNSEFVYQDMIASIRGSDTVIFENNTFINNKGTNVGFVMWNLSPAKIIAKNNYFKGYNSFLYTGSDSATTEYTNILLT